MLRQTYDADKLVRCRVGLEDIAGFSFRIGKIKNLVESTARGSAEVKKSPNFGEDCIIGETARIGAKP